MTLVRKATVDDVKDIVSLVNNYAQMQMMLSKSSYKVYSSLQTFYVAEVKEKIVGCASLSVLWSDLGEICSLAVDENYKKMGIGKLLVTRCIDDAKLLKLPRVIALTYQAKFFEKMGFHIEDKNKFPRKLWRECLECPKLEQCDELAYVLDL